MEVDMKTETPNIPDATPPLPLTPNINDKKLYSWEIYDFIHLNMSTF